MKRKIALVYGGKSPEHEVSCDSAATIAAELIAGGHEVRPVYITREGKWLLQQPDQLGKCEGIEAVPSLHSSCFNNVSGEELFRPDVVFPIVHGTTGEDGVLQGVFELMGVPYAGAGLTASACGMNKAVSKELVKAAGINVLPHIIILESDRRDKPEFDSRLCEAEKLGFPLFVKPVSQGSSVGITKVKTFNDLAAAVNNAFRFDIAVMIEKGVDCAREMVCGVLGSISECEASPVGEVCVQGTHEFYDYEAKYLDNDGMRLVIPANLEKEQSDYIRSSAVSVFRALGCSGFARVDFFMDRNSGQIWFGEINTAPGFTSHSLYPALWKSAGFPIIRTLERIMEIAISDREARKKLEIRR